MKNLEWIRVSRKSPCPICQKPDWCNVIEDGSTIHCMRVQNGSPSHGKAGGWIHKVSDDRPRAKYVKPVKHATVKIDAPTLFYKWQNYTEAKPLIALAASLGVEPMALHVIGCAWAPEHGAWAFPMKDENSKIIGIRLRSESGEKWAVTGSKAGLFTPHDMAPRECLYIVEGPTDCAAALTLGLYAIGRPSCLGSEDQVNGFVRKNKIKNVVIISDNDEAGLQGSDVLQSKLKSPSLIIALPAKDIREFLKSGGTRQMIDDLVKNRVWVNPFKSMITG